VLGFLREVNAGVDEPGHDLGCGSRVRRRDAGAESSARADKALHNQPRSPGLDLISRGGTVVVTVKK